MTAAQQTPLGLPSSTQRQVAIDVRSLALALIAPDPAQPRKDFDGLALGELAESIKAHGVLQPILVRPVPASRPASVPKDCQYLVIAGERRFRACHLAGLDEIPAQIRTDLTADEIAVVQVLENLQRRDLSFAETARGIALLADKIGVTEAGKQLGKDKSWVSRHAHVLKLRKPIVELVQAGLIESVDIAHELHSLFDLNEAKASQLLLEFREPPSWRGTPPTRQAIRSAIDVEKQRIQSEKDLKREEEERARRQAQQSIVDLANQYAGAVTYRHPNDPALTWTGRGRAPAWVEEWKAKHGNLDGCKAGTAPAIVEVGAWVGTNYGTGPYLVTSITGPCDCPKYLEQINLGDAAPKSEPHYHLICRAEGDKKDSYLNGYRLDGTSVWGEDRLVRADAPESQLDGLQTESGEQTANREAREKSKAEWQAAQAKLAQLKAHAEQVGHRLSGLVLAHIGIERRPRPDDEQETDHLRNGRAVTCNFGDLPVEISGINLHNNPHVSAQTREEIRYGITVDLCDLTETEVEELVGQLSGSKPDTRYEQPGLRDLHRFVEDFTQPSPGESVRNDWLFEQYGKWCKKQKISPLSNQHFGEAMPRLGYEKVRKEAGRSYLNIAPKGKA